MAIVSSAFLCFIIFARAARNIISRKAPHTAAVSYEYGSDPELVKDGTGIYHLDLTFSACGVWAARCYGTGALVAGSADTLINVKETRTD